MAEKKKVTTMVLKVDLQCHKCYKKVKKVLCKFPQIQDQAYDEKQNLVVIKVVCCSPEKMRDRIRAKGGCAIESIEIQEDKKKPTPPPSSPPKPPPIPPPTNQSYTLNVIACCTNCYHGHHGYCRWPECDCGCGRSYSCNYGVARSYCFSEENPQGCTVM